MASRKHLLSGRLPESGIALISALLLLILLSALGVALMYKVNYESHLQKTDSSNNVAYYGAEAAMEKMTADLDNLYGAQATPNWCDIKALQSQQPSISDINVTYAEYEITIPDPPSDCSVPPSHTQNISQGPNAGLIAQIVPLTLRVTADHASGNQSPEEVRMIRQVEVAEIPVFQFGVYSDSDLSFFAGPDFDFTGRVHTNSNLFIAEGNGQTLTFHTPVRAAGDIVRDQLSNGVDTWSQSYQGPVKVPTTTAGCDNAQPACRPLGLNPTNEGSSIGGPTPTYGGKGKVNPIWTNISNTTYNGMILSGSTGAKQLKMAFVQAGVGPIEILRRPASGEPQTSALGESRLYNQAQIRVLLSDDPNDLPGGASDGQNIRLANVKTNSNAPDYSNGVPVTSLPLGTDSFFAEGNTNSNTTETNWGTPPVHETTLADPKAPLITSSTWNLLDGYLRVEYRRSDGSYVPVTQEWLELGFARGFNPPKAGVPNNVHPNAILIFQMKADRNHDGIENNGTPPELLKDPTTGNNYAGPKTRNNWYPINFYDVREGELRENQTTTTNCRVGGIMNLVEIDVSNLRKWLSGKIGKNGTDVEYVSRNGYILYFSDRRGMISNPNIGAKNGEYGFEDVVNPLTTSGAPNGTLDNGEDADGNQKLDTWGKATLGLGFGAGNSGNPYTQVSCLNAGRPNWVSGARHGVRLIDGALGTVPTRPDGTGGFTLASENPAYLLGDYNASGSFGDPHAASAILADTVTLLSNSWTDNESFLAPLDTSKRNATETWFRVAIASGKNISFPKPTYSGAPKDFGTDGGVHNFLRYLENWSGTKSHYLGSMASMYYSQYGTGIFKCCNMVYQPPSRAYAFDSDFLDMNKLPPGTPRFRDVVSTGFQQVF
ncbi:MAG TPA: hypothetical protein VG897_11770 [Terriglobales bacterium]|nr:hypothetical protein [Terriglobales bacterium]